MLKNLSKFECSIEGRLYQLFCDSDSPTPHLKEFMFQVAKIIGQIEDHAKSKEDEKKIAPVEEDLTTEG